MNYSAILEVGCNVFLLSLFINKLDNPSSGDSEETLVEFRIALRINNFISNVIAAE